MRRLTFIFLLASLAGCSSLKNKGTPIDLPKKSEPVKETAGINLFALHELLSKGDLKNLEKNLESIPENIQQGVEKQLRTLVSRLGVQKSTIIYEYDIPKSSIETFFQLREKKRNFKPMEFPKIHQEEWLISGRYEACGFQGPSAVLQLVPESPKVEDISSCLEKKTSYIKILDMDREWIFFQFEKRPLNYSEQESSEEPDNVYTYRTPRRTLTTPVVLSDGNIDIALMRDGIVEIHVGKKTFNTRGKYQCGYREEGIKLIQEKEDYFDWDYDIYLFPKGFENSKLFIRENSPGNIYHSEYCEGGC